MNYLLKKLILKKRFLSALIIFLAVSILLSSCKTINVASYNKIQKRKYTKGFYVKNYSKSKEEVFEKNDYKTDSEKRSFDNIQMFACRDTNMLLASKESDIGMIINQSKRFWYINNLQVKEKNATTENHTDSNKKIHEITKKSDRHPISLSVKNSDTSTQQQKGIGGVFGFFFSLIGIIFIGSGILGLIFSASELFTRPPSGYVGRHLAQIDGWTYAGFFLGLIDVIGWALLLTFLFISGFATAGFIILIIQGILALAAVLAYILLEN